LILRARSARKIIQSGEFAPFGRELSALKPENSPPKAGCFRAGFQNENCCKIKGFRKIDENVDSIQDRKGGLLSGFQARILHPLGANSWLGSRY